MAIKGTTKIELTNVHTGEKEVVEHHNMITNVLSDMNKRMYGVNGMDTFLYMYAKQFLGADDPFWKAMFSGIILFEDSLSNNADEYIFPAGNKVTGCGDIERVRTQDMTDPSCSVIGNFNSEESILKGNMAKMVYDFSTSQGNGTISSISLCNKLLARSCYAYNSNIKAINLYNDGNFSPRCQTKNAIIKSIAVDGNVYAISYYHYDTDNLKIKMSSIINRGDLLGHPVNTISIDLGASDYSYYFSLGDKNIIVLYSKTTGKFKYVSLIDGSVSEKNVPSGYDNVYPFDGYFIAIKKVDALYYYSVLKDDGTMLHENIFSAGKIYGLTQGLLGGKYILADDGTNTHIIDISSGGVSKLYTKNDFYNKMYYFAFNNIYHMSINGNEYFMTWQPWLTTKNNLETPVTKTADKTMKVTYTLTEA